MTPAFSVILATHDRPESLRRAVESVLAQTHRPAQVVVVCDAPGGLDADVRDELARKVRAADVAWESIDRPTPSLPASRNAGIDAATGEVLLLLDDDHELPTDYLARLGAMYRADAGEHVDAIGGFVTPPSGAPQAAGRGVWECLMRLSGHMRWRPRRVRARRVHPNLPPALRRVLRPAAYLTGGTVSLRRRAAARVRYDEGLSGYALGEDREFSYRATQHLAVFDAPSLTMTHHRDPGGRLDGCAYGRMIVANFTRIARRALEPGLGKWVLLGWNLAGLACAHLAFCMVGNRTWHAGVIRGMLGQLLHTARRALRGDPCEC